MNTLLSPNTQSSSTQTPQNNKGVLRLGIYLFIALFLIPLIGTLAIYATSDADGQSYILLQFVAMAVFNVPALLVSGILIAIAGAFYAKGIKYARILSYISIVASSVGLLFMLGWTIVAIATS